MIYLSSSKFSRPAVLIGRSFGAARKAASRVMFLIVASLVLPTVANAEYVRIGAGQPSLSPLSLGTDITVPNNPALGTVLKSAAWNPGINASITTCPVNESAVVSGTLAPGYTNVYLTNVPGLGVRFSITAGWGGAFTTAPYQATFNAEGKNISYWLKADLIVVGPVAGGTLTTIPSLSITFSGTCFDKITQGQTVQVGTIMATSTCSVTTPSLSVSLPQLRTASVPSVGSTWGGTNFSIGVNCAAAANAYLALSDASTPGNTSKVLSAAAGSTAKGVGFQIASGATVLSFGPASAASGQAQTWSAGKMNVGANTIPLTVSYIRSGTMGSGVIKGLATFTMSYQ